MQFIDCACDRQTARLCSLTRDNLEQTNMQNRHFSDGSCFSLIITLVIILKQLFASGSVNSGEYSPRLRLGEYPPKETLRSRFGHLTANAKPRFAVCGFTLAVCPYLGLKIHG